MLLSKSSGGWIGMRLRKPLEHRKIQGMISHVDPISGKNPELLLISRLQGEQNIEKTIQSHFFRWGKRMSWTYIFLYKHIYIVNELFGLNCFSAWWDLFWWVSWDMFATGFIDWGNFHGMSPSWILEYISIWYIYVVLVIYIYNLYAYRYIFLYHSLFVFILHFWPRRNLLNAYMPHML